MNKGFIATILAVIMCIQLTGCGTVVNDTQTDSSVMQDAASSDATISDDSSGFVLLSEAGISS